MMITMFYKMAEDQTETVWSITSVSCCCSSTSLSAVALELRSQIPYGEHCQHKHGALFMFKHPWRHVLTALDNSCFSIQVVYANYDVTN